MTNKIIFADRLFSLRKENNLTRQKVSDSLGITRAALEYYEKGKRTPDVNMIAKMASYYGVSTDYLLGCSDARSSDDKIRIACDVTGLDEKHIITLQLAKKEKQLSDQVDLIDNHISVTYLEVINYLLSAIELYPFPLTNLIDMLYFLGDDSNLGDNTTLYPIGGVMSSRNKGETIMMTSERYHNLLDHSTRDSFAELYDKILNNISSFRCSQDDETSELFLLRQFLNKSIEELNEKIESANNSLLCKINSDTEDEE
ncbi:MAG: helix-turn-helix transcriptional regulator [Clostridia bacterium]|nr:helix-turn-helix transcriptional regulator [Clostridia bacterium]